MIAIFRRRISRFCGGKRDELAGESHLTDTHSPNSKDLSKTGQDHDSFDTGPKHRLDRVDVPCRKIERVGAKRTAAQPSVPLTPALLTFWGGRLGDMLSLLMIIGWA